MEAIPISQRYEGMMVYVQADDVLYTLIGGTSNSNWSMKHDKLLVRSDTEANWLEADPVLRAGEPAYVTDKRMTKHGDGTTAFSQLPYDYSYESQIPVSKAIGGYDKGDVVTNTDILTVIDTLLHPYAAPTCKSFTTNPTTSTRSAGNPVTSTSLSVTVELGSRTLSKVEFMLDGTVVATVTTPTSTSTNNGVVTNVYSTTYSTSYGSTNTTGASVGRKWTCKVTDSAGTVTTFTNSTTITFVGPSYVGAVNNGTTIDTATVTGLTASNWLKTNYTGFNGTAKLKYSGANKQLVVAYPASFGNISGVYDQNGFDITSTFGNSTTVTVTLNGASVSYKVYYTDNIAADNTDFTVYFKI